MGRSAILGVMLLALASTTTVVAEGNPSLFLVDGTFGSLWTRIFQVDPDSGALQLRADLGTAYTPMLGMAAASRTTLYLTGTDLGPDNLCQGDIACLLIRVELDPLSTTPSLMQIIGTLTVSGVMLPGITGLTFRNDGRLYAISQTTGGLYTIDLATAQATLIGIVDIPLHGGDITFDGEDRLWIWANIGAGSGIYQLDPNTAHASAFDLHPGLDLAGMAALGHGDELRGASSGTDRLYEIDSTIGLTGINYRLKLNGSNFDHSRGDLDSPFCEEDSACADQNVCTTDRCAPGGCDHPAVPDGDGCNDGDLCTQVDSCQSGICAGGSPVVCAAPDACHDPGTCDPTSGNCENAPEKPDGTPCDDGNACTQVDSCLSGTCTGATPVICPAADACHDPGICNAQTGICEAGAPKPDGTQCDDGNACTQVDSCQSGTCTGATPVICPAADACHNPETCNPASGICEAGAPKPDGTQCDDGNACTQVDSCQSGTCTGATPVICPAADACHNPETCNPASGICEAGAPKPDGTQCDDGNACTQVDSCQSGTCTGATPVICPAADACHNPETCNPASGICEAGAPKPDGTQCDDGNACTQVDSCQSGTCTGATPVICPAADACHNPETCNPASGICEAGAPKPDGTQCDDGNACTQVDSCQAGTCTGATPVICPAADACHNPETCNPASGICEAGAPKPDGTQCDDGNACTQVDSCQSGTCTGATPVICPAADACHDPGICNAQTGICEAGTPKPDGTQCEDGNACTQVDTCQAGVCQGGPPTDLDGDGHANSQCGGTDCLDANPFVWNSPFEVTNLGANPSNPANFIWDSQDALAGPGTTFNLVSGAISDLHGSGFSPSDCLQGAGGNSYTDTRPDPVIGAGYWYLTRATNSCGVGTYGSSARDSGITPCP